MNEDSNTPEAVKPNSGAAIENEAVEEVKLSTTKAGSEVFEYLRKIYNGQKLSKSFKDEFSKLKDVSPIGHDELAALLCLAHEKDNQNKVLLSLSEFLLENYGNLSSREQLLTYIEYCFSNVGSLAEVNNNTQLQHWVDQSDVTNKLDFVFQQINSLWQYEENRETKSELPDSKKNLLKCVSAIWLYYKDLVTPEQVVEKLSREAFEVDRSVSGQIERRALAFIAKMLVSTNREGFAFFMNYVNQQIRNSRQDASVLRDEKFRAEHRVRSVEEQLRTASDQLKHKNELVQQLNAEIEQLQQLVAQARSEKTHQSIHHNSQRSVDQANVNSFLSEEVLPNVKAALAANSRTPPKSERVAKLLMEIQERIEGRKM